MRVTRQQIENMTRLDEAAQRAGGYVARQSAGREHYDYRRLLSYCRDTGKKPVELTPDEARQFLLP